MSINKGLEPSEKKLVGYVDMTPKWEEMVDILVGFVEHGDANQQSIARDEIRRMARAADAYNSMQNKITEVIEATTESLVQTLPRLMPRK